MIRPYGERQALVLSGGSVYAAYEVGVLRALLGGESPATGYQPLRPDILVGTSAGSVNAAVLVAQATRGADAAVEYLENLWLNQLAADARHCRNGAIRVRGDLGSYLNLQCLAANPLKPLQYLAQDATFLASQLLTKGANFASSRQPLARRALEFVDISTLISNAGFQQIVAQAVDMAAVRASEIILQIASTNWRTGELKLFNNADMSDEVGPRVIIASSAFPGIPPVVIDGEPYVDGGYVMNTPLRPAWDAGASLMHVVYLDPDIKNIPLREIDNSFDVFDKLYHIMMATIFNRDIDLYADINTGLELLAGAPTPAPPDPADRTLQEDRERAILRLAGRLQRAAPGLGPYRKVVLHRYHPAEDLGGVVGLMNFDRGHVEQLIDAGYQDALHHDCAASGCLIPS